MKLLEAFAGSLQFRNLHLFDVFFDIFAVLLIPVIAFFVKILVVLYGNLATVISLFVDCFKHILPLE